MPGAFCVNWRGKSQITQQMATESRVPVSDGLRTTGYQRLHFCIVNGGTVIIMASTRSLRLSLVLSVTLVWTSAGLGQEPAQAPSLETQSPPATPGTAGEAQRPGSISGTIIDPTGAVIKGAEVTLSIAGLPLRQKATSDSKGQFSFANVPPGPFQLAIQSTGFAAQTFSGTLEPGQTENLLPIMLSVGTAITSVEVGVPQIEVAQEELHVEEKQRVLGIVPNFYVTYIPNAAPLDMKQKFQLALRTVIDPFTLIVVAGTAGIQQAQDHFAAYGQGAQGYGKRFGAGYADTVDGTFFGGALFPWLLKQDPRYFYKGTGTIRARTSYAISRAFICKGDNGRWQPNYSGVLGELAAGGISNLYYPADDRHGVGLTFGNAAIGIAGNAVGNVFQEFVVPKLTPMLHKKDHNKSSLPQTAPNE